jgi:hypothetical protein
MEGNRPPRAFVSSKARLLLVDDYWVNAGAPFPTLLLDPAVRVPAMNFLAKLLLGNGSLKPELKRELESEGLVLIEEGLGGSVRYSHFKAPGKRFNGKITPERMGIGISKERVVVYCKSGRAQLMNSPFTSERLKSVDASLDGDDKLEIRIDYDTMGEPRVSGEVKLVMKTPNARRIVGELEARLPR